MAELIYILVVEDHVRGRILDEVIHWTQVFFRIFAPREVYYLVVVGKLDIELISEIVLQQLNSKCRAIICVVFVTKSVPVTKELQSLHEI
jgi:hypothetical protein